MGKSRQTGNLVSENNIAVDIVNDRIGIGTTNPTSKLTVQGDVLVSGVVTASNFVGNLTGTATTSVTAFGLTGTPNINVGIITANNIQSNTVVSGIVSATSSIDGSAFESFEVDDLSSATNGIDNTFTPTFNYSNVTITNPFRLMITVNGILQSAFINNTDFVYQSNFLGSNNGYTLDSDNNIKFTESIPTGSDIVVRVLPVSNTPTRIKYYPFKPTDILLGY